MNIHEYQAREILESFGVPVPGAYVANTVEEAVEAGKLLQQKYNSDKWVVKAQIHAGGRGKGGGVKLAGSLDELAQHADNILGMQLVTHQTGPKGKKVNKVMIAQNVFYDGPSKPSEFYMSVLLNRDTGKNIIMYSTEGGMDIETVAANTPELIYKEEINPGSGVMPFQARRIAFNLGLTGTAFKNMVKFVKALYNAYEKSDASLMEINPVLKTSDDLILAIDAKVNLDDNALFRHSDYAAMLDPEEEDAAELKAAESNLNFVKLDGNVGCMVNGAGLAMATMDIIKLSGGEPANFLDVGGGANAQTVEAGLNIILEDPNVKAILINIFGGIVRCDRVAEGVVEAYKNIGNIDVPIIVRLQGTNAQEGKELIDNSGLKVYSAITLKEASDLVQKTV